MNADQLEAIDKLGEFIDFVYHALDNMPPRHYRKRKKSVLLPMYINVCDLAGSVQHLLKEERVNSAQNLIRSMQESWINTRFIFVDGSYLWVDSYILESEIDMKKFVNGARRLRQKYPNADTSQATFDTVKLQEIEDRSNKFIDYVRTKYQTLPTIPDVGIRNASQLPYTLRDKTRIVDHILQTRIAPKDLKYSDEWQYLMVYKYLSGGTHIGSRYLASNLIRQDRTVTTILKHGDKKGIQLCAWSAYAFLYDMTTAFAKQFGNPALSSLRPYHATMKMIGSKIP